jgi:hypothetical protein
MTLITVEVSDRMLEQMKKYAITPEEALDYGADLLIKEEPDEESLRKFEESERDDRGYTAETVEDAFKRLGLDKW